MSLRGRYFLLVGDPTHAAHLEAQLHALGASLVGRAECASATATAIAAAQPDVVLACFSQPPAPRELELARDLSTRHGLAILALCPAFDDAMIEALEPVACEACLTLPVRDDGLRAALHTLVAKTARRSSPAEAEGGIGRRSDGLAADVPALHLAQEKWQETQDRLELALRSSGTCTWENDVLGNRVTLDRTWNEMRGYPPHPVVVSSRRLVSESHPDDRERVMEEAKRAIRGDTDEYLVEHRVATAQGGWLWILSHGRVTARDERGRATRIIGTNTDIQARKAAEARVHALNQRLERLVEERTARLRDSEHRLRALFERSPIPKALLTTEGRIVELNNAALLTLGLSRDEAVGQLARDLELWENPADPPRLISALRDRHEVVNLETHLRRKNAASFPALVTATVIEIEGEAFILATIQDLTLRKQAERSLERAHRRVTVLAQLGRELAEAETPRNALLSILEAARQLLGWDCCWLQLWNEETRSFDHPVNFDLVDGERREVPTNIAALRNPSPIILKTMQEGPQLVLREASNEAGVSTPPFGQARHSLSLLFVPIKREGRLLGIVSIQSYARDAYDRTSLDLLVTLADHCAGALARLQAREALVESEERFRTAFDASPIPILVTGLPEGDLIEVNSAALTSFGYTREEVIGRNTAAIGVWARPEQREEFFRRIAHARTIHGFEAVMRDKAGNEHIMLCTGTVLTLGRRTCALTSAVDITAARKAEAEKAELHERLYQRQKYEALGTLAGGVAHDFNNILTGVINFTALAREECPPGYPLVLEYLDQVLTSGHRAKNLTRQILLFSRAEDGKHEVLQLQSILKEALALLRSTLPTSVTIIADIESAASPVLANATQLHQVIMNLGVNAAQALSEQRGAITVRLRAVTLGENEVAALPDLKPGAFVTLEVADTGCGMSEEIRARIFEPFFTTKPVGSGTGLGLAVVHSVVRSHHGAITVKTALGSGSVFTIYLPAQSAARPALPKSKLAHSFAGSGERILLVDDEAIVADSVGRLLGHLGYRVTYFDDPKKALERFQAEPMTFDAVITDLQMPGLSGVELAQRILALRRELPVIVASGYTGDISVDQLKSAGVAALIEKPFSFEELSRTLSLAFRKRT